MKKNKLDVIETLAEARTKLVIAAIVIEQVYGNKRAENHNQLIGAADMIHSWIEAIREEI